MKLLLTILSIIVFLNEGVAQSRYNKLYRFDSLQYNSVKFHGMRVVDSSIYTVGIGVIVDSGFLTNPGIFTRFSLKGDIIYNKYLGNFPTSNEVWRDAILPTSKGELLVAGHNWDSSFSATMFNKNGVTIFKKKYFPVISGTGYRLPPSVAEINNNRFVIISVNNIGFTGKPAIIIIDSLGTQIKNLKIESGWDKTGPIQVNLNRAKNLSIMTFSDSGDFQQVTYQYVTQLYELDTTGTVLWRYQTPINRYIYSDGFVQLANSNYLMWGYEEYSRPDAVNRFRLLDSVRPFLREIKPNVGVVWERNFDMIYQPTIYDLKILKDSSIVFVGQYLDTANVLLKQGYLIKLNKNRDSIFKRNLVHPAFSHGMAFYFPQKIEELDNGDLVIAGYAQDNKVGSPTRYTWGWLIRTDSLGCSLTPNCRVPTEEVEKGPLSINVYPNPASAQMTIDYQFITPQNNAYIEIVDILGRSVFQRKIDAIQGQVTWNVTNIPQGIYYVYVKNDGKITWQTKAFVIK